MHLRRVLLLFALVFGVSALVASLAPPPDPGDEEPAAPTERGEPRQPSAGPIAAGSTRRIVLTVPDAEAAEPPAATPIRRLPTGSSVLLEVSVPEPGEVVVDGLGLRESGVPRAPARFAFLAQPAGRYPVMFVPLAGEPRTAGRLEFVRRAGG